MIICYSFCSSKGRRRRVQQVGRYRCPMACSCRYLGCREGSLARHSLELWSHLSCCSHRLPVGRFGLALRWPSAAAGPLSLFSFSCSFFVMFCSPLLGGIHSLSSLCRQGFTPPAFSSCRPYGAILRSSSCPLWASPPHALCVIASEAWQSRSPILQSR